MIKKLMKTRSHANGFPRFIKFGIIVMLATIPDNSYCAEGKSLGSPNQNGNDDRDMSNFRQLFQKLLSKEDSFQNILASEFNEGSLSPVKKLFDEGVPVQVGYGFLMGYSSGYCIKKVSKVVAFVVGSAFILLQTLSYTGHIKVDYNKLQKDAEQILDMNNDGKVDIEDAKISYEKVQKILGHQMPAGSGFAAGLFMGLRK